MRGRAHPAHLAKMTACPSVTVAAGEEFDQSKSAQCPDLASLSSRRRSASRRRALGSQQSGGPSDSTAESAFAGDRCGWVSELASSERRA